MTDAPRVVSRRERLRAQTLQEIEDASFAIIDAEGVHALSLAALAPSLAMSAPALYRYFASRDALVAHLVDLSYAQLTAAMAEAAGSSRRAPQTRVKLLVAAYREWALRHPRRYGMLFGEQVGDMTVDPAAKTPLDQSMTLLIDLLVAAQGSSPADGSSGDRTLDSQLRLWARARERPETTPRAGRAAIVIWTRVHGIVSLELTGMFAGQSVEAQRLIDLEIDSAIRSL